MEKRPRCAFGRAINHALIDLEKSKSWLVEQVRGKVDLYFDSAYLSRIETGQLKTPSIINAICEVLDIQYEA